MKKGLEVGFPPKLLLTKPVLGGLNLNLKAPAAAGTVTAVLVCVLV